MPLHAAGETYAGNYQNAEARTHEFGGHVSQVRLRCAGAAYTEHHRLSPEQFSWGWASAAEVGCFSRHRSESWCAYRYLPSPAVAYRYLPLPTVTYRYLPLQVRRV